MNSSFFQFKLLPLLIKNLAPSIKLAGMINRHRSRRAVLLLAPGTWVRECREDARGLLIAFDL